MHTTLLDKRHIPLTPITTIPTDNPCGTCGACCRSYIVPVTGYDIWLLSKGQQLSPEQYLVACPQEEPAMDGFRLEPDGTTFGLALDKQGRFDPQRPCVFLMQFANGNTRCGVYGERPVVCRAYPMSIWHGKISLMERALCPPNSWPLGAAERPSWPLAIHQVYMQFDVYHEVVARWNARVQTAPAGTRFSLHEYFSYILNTYERLVALEAQIGEEGMIEVRASWPTAPRPDVDPEQLLVSGSELPWLNYLMRAREEIDAFYPHIESQPLLALIESNSPSTASALPVEEQRTSQV